MEDIKKQIQDSIQVKSTLLKENVETIKTIADTIVNSLKHGGFIYLIGNGGSAADAQHFAGELVGRYKKNRAALPAIALTTDTSVITAIGNDFGYERCFVRQVEAFVKKGDVVIGISTSGNSQNIINALKLADKKGAKTIGLTGKGGGAIKDCAGICLQVPSDDTPRIQESHITVLHILCSIIEKEIFK